MSIRFKIVYSSVLLITGIGFSSFSIANDSVPVTNIENDSQYSANKEIFFKKTELSNKENDYLTSQIKMAQAKLKLKELNDELSGKNEAKAIDVAKLKESLTKEIEALKAQINSESTKNNSTESTIDNITPEKEAESILSDFYLTSIYGSAPKMNAILMYRGGTTKVKVGSELPGGWKVVSINRSFISVNHNDIAGTQQISFKSPAIIQKELDLKQEMQFSKIKNQIEVDKMKMQNEALPVVKK